MTITRRAVTIRMMYVLVQVGPSTFTTPLEKLSQVFTMVIRTSSTFSPLELRAARQNYSKWLLQHNSMNFPRSGVTLIRMNYRVQGAGGEIQHNLTAASTCPRHALRSAADSCSTLTHCGFCETRLLRLVLTPLPRSRCPS